MEHILVSACLCGKNCKWDGGNNKTQRLLDYMEYMKGRAEFHEVCPEQMGGLSTPRNPAERVGDKVISNAGQDVTKEYQKGAEEALKLAKFFGCKVALLKEKSPACGTGLIYDGTFRKNLVPGDGVAAEFLRRNGMEVFGESEIEKIPQKQMG